MLSIITLLIVLLLSILVTRVATVALTHTGLSKESARFQARSAFTGVGFTTDESEKVVNHPVRRRILMVLMLLGNAGVVTAVSSLIVSFVNIEATAVLFWQVVLLITGILLLWTVANSSYVDRHLSNIISLFLKKYTSINVHDYAKLLHLAGEYQISEIFIDDSHWLAGKSLAECDLREKGVSILGLTKKDGTYSGVPGAATRIDSGDTLIAYGRGATIADVSAVHQGAAGTN